MKSAGAGIAGVGIDDLRCASRSSSQELADLEPRSLSWLPFEVGHA